MHSTVLYCCTVLCCQLVYLFGDHDLSPIAIGRSRERCCRPFPPHLLTPSIDRGIQKTSCPNPGERVFSNASVSPRCACMQRFAHHASTGRTPLWKHRNAQKPACSQPSAACAAVPRGAVCTCHARCAPTFVSITILKAAPQRTALKCTVAPRALWRNTTWSSNLGMQSPQRRPSSLPTIQICSEVIS